MRNAVILLIASCFMTTLVLCAAPSASAHHSTAMYDMEHPTTIKGVVKNVEWTNPHGYIYLDVKEANGQVIEWAVEINSPNFLRHNGWTSSMVKSGDTITVTGGAAKSGAKTMRCTTVVLADGTELRS